MLKIDISTIRKNASNLIELNDGYLLYQQKKASNVSLVQDQTLTYDFVIEGEFEDVGRVSLFVGLEPHGDCKCSKNKLCKHEICLFFHLKDLCWKMMNDKDLMASYETNRKMDRLLSNVYQELISDSHQNIEVKPTVAFLDSLGLFLDVYIDQDKKKVKDVKGFYNAIKNNSDYTFNYTTIKLNMRMFTGRSKRLLNLLKFLEFGSNFVKLDETIFDDIYELYNDSIFVFNGYYSKEYKFTKDKFILNIDVLDNKISIIDTNYKIINSLKYVYIFYKEKIYVTDNKCLYLVLKHLSDNNGSIEFSKEAYNSFLINIYPSITDFVLGVNYCYNLDIDTYIDFKNNSLSLSFKTDIDNSLLFVNRTNYLNTISLYGFNKENNYTINSFDDICDFIKYKSNNLKKYGHIYMSEDALNIKINNMKKLKFNLHLDGGLVDILYDNTVYSKEDLDSIILAYRKNEKYIKISDEIIEINYDEIEKISEIMEELNLDSLDSAKIMLYQAYYAKEKFQGYFNVDEELDSFVNDIVSYNDSNIVLNESISNILRDYQVSGIKWLATLSKYNFGGILADDMGLGKTLQIIALIESLKVDKPVLIVSPTSLIFNWAMEIEKFAPTIKHRVMYDTLRGEESVREASLNNYVMIVSYETLRTHFEFYKDIDFALCVVDEAQYIKNPDALKTIACKGIKAKIKIALTGTPIENSLLDLWSIFDFVLPGYLGPKLKFISKYENYSLNSDVLKDLNKRIQPFMLRRLKTDVLDLEEKIETISYSIMSDEEKDIYNSYLKDARNDLSQDNYKISKVLSILTRLRQIACEPRLFIENVDARNSKMDLLMELIEEKISDNHKILVFSQFTSIFPFMEERLKDMNVRYVKLTGSTNSLDRASLVEEFNKNEDIKVFLISLKAGGTGLNLTGADTVIHYDPWWNNAAMNQATDRAYRLGQDKVVHVIKMINKDTIEEKILDLQRRKMELFDSVISEDEAIKKISIDDLKELFI